MYAPVIFVSQVLGFFNAFSAKFAGSLTEIAEKPVVKFIFAILVVFDQFQTVSDVQRAALIAKVSCADLLDNIQGV